MYNVTERGWQGFTDVIVSSYSALVKLDICFHGINDATNILLVNALFGNCKLEVLAIVESKVEISTEVLAAISHVLCNTSSIAHTHNSNHILKAISEDYDNVD